MKASYSTAYDEYGSEGTEGETVDGESENSASTEDDDNDDDNDDKNDDKNDDTDEKVSV